MNNANSMLRIVQTCVATMMAMALLSSGLCSMPPRLNEFRKEFPEIKPVSVNAQANNFASLGGTARLRNVNCPFPYDKQAFS